LRQRVFCLFAPPGKLVGIALSEEQVNDGLDIREIMFRFPVEARSMSLTSVLKTYDVIEVEKPYVKSVYCITGYII